MSLNLDDVRMADYVQRIDDAINLLSEYFNCPGDMCIQYGDKQDTEIDTPHIKISPNFDFGTALLSKYDIIDEVLKYLQYSDLKQLSLVNSTWANLVDDCLKKRLSPNVFCFTKHYSASDHSLCSYNKPILGIVLMNHLKMNLNRYVCIHRGTTVENFKKTVIEFIEDDILAKVKCPIIVLSCQQSEICYPEGLFFNGLALPSIPDVSVSIIRIVDDKKEVIVEEINKQIEEDRIVSCLLTFCLPHTPGRILKKVEPVIDTIKERQVNKKFSFAGGLVTGLKTFNVNDPSKCKKKKDLVCLIIKVPINNDVHFQSYSIKIPNESCQKQNELDSIFVNFKKHFKQRKHSVALRFSCISLDSLVPKVCVSFSKHFPDIKMIGFSCNGEFGWTNYNEKEDSEEDVSPKKKLKQTEQLLNYFTIFFVIFTWGKEIS